MFPLKSEQLSPFRKSKTFPQMKAIELNAINLSHNVLIFCIENISETKFHYSFFSSIRYETHRQKNEPTQTLRSEW
jgi:hypothetical protein